MRRRCGGRFLGFDFDKGRRRRFLGCCHDSTFPRQLTPAASISLHYDHTMLL
jgi:hypothetical protein